MEFNGHTKANAEAPKGKSFLASAKQKHQELFHNYVGRQGDFADLQEYTDALQVEAWKLTEEITKQSWKNGVVQGERRARR